ncbi:MAG: ATP-binding cassette domain-containing protein [Pseudomonadota bacterium]
MLDPSTCSLLPLNLRQATLTLHGTRIIDGIDLSIDEPGCHVILGFNGAGKTFLLRLINGLVNPASGSLSWGVADPDTIRKRQAFVFQRPVLLRRTVEANLKFALQAAGINKDQHTRKIASALKDTPLEDKGNRYAPSLSGGERQLLAIVRATIIEPEILLLDEPTSSLDPLTVATIEALLFKAKSEGRTLFLVTHDLGQARRLADHVLFLHCGQIVERSLAGDFFSAPKSAPARAFIDGYLPA